MHPGRKDPTRLFTYSPENWLPLTRSWPRPLKGGHVKRSLLKSQTAFLVFAPRQSGLLCTDSEFPRKVSVLCLPTTHSPPSFPVSVQSLCSWCSLCAPVANSCGRHNCLRPEVGQGSAWSEVGVIGEQHHSEVTVREMAHRSSCSSDRVEPRGKHG